MDMIKLMDLLQSMQQQQAMLELDIRRGELKNIVSKEDVYTTFFEDFDIFDEDEFDIEAEVGNRKLKYKELIDVDGYKLIDPLGFENTKYLINSEGKTWKEFIVGSVDIEDVMDKPYNLKGGQIKLTRITKFYKGKGLGALMYYMVLVHYRNLFSDNILYEGSRNIWLKKIYTAADFFGAEINEEFYVPLTFEDANNTSLMKNLAVDSYLASVAPTKQMMKLKKYVGNYSLSTGEYGIYETPLSSDDLTDLVDESTDLNDLLSNKLLMSIIPANDNPKAIVVSCENVVVVITNKLDILPI